MAPFLELAQRQPGVLENILPHVGSPISGLGDLRSVLGAQYHHRRSSPGLEIVAGNPHGSHGADQGFQHTLACFLA